MIEIRSGSFHIVRTLFVTYDESQGAIQLKTPQIRGKLAQASDILHIIDAGVY